jgi:hypothetical protein
MCEYAGLCNSSTMDVIEYTPIRGHYAYTFGGVASAMRPG